MKTITIMDTCPICNGERHLPTLVGEKPEPCENCDGTGAVEQDVTLEQLARMLAPILRVLVPLEVSSIHAEIQAINDRLGDHLNS